MVEGTTGVRLAMAQQLEMFTSDEMGTLSQQWITDCKIYRGRVLTGKKRHYCIDWDQLPMDETCYEYEEGMCCCEIEDEK